MGDARESYSREPGRQCGANLTFSAHLVSKGALCVCNSPTAGMTFGCRVRTLEVQYVKKASMGGLTEFRGTRCQPKDAWTLSREPKTQILPTTTVYKRMPKVSGTGLA